MFHLRLHGACAAAQRGDALLGRQQGEHGRNAEDEAFGGGLTRQSRNNVQDSGQKHLDSGIEMNLRNGAPAVVGGNIGHETGIVMPARVLPGECKDRPQEGAKKRFQRKHAVVPFTVQRFEPRRRQRFRPPGNRLAKQGFLPAAMMVHRSQRFTGLRGDLANGGAIESSSRKHLLGGIQNPFPRRQRALRRRPFARQISVFGRVHGNTLPYFEHVFKITKKREGLLDKTSDRLALIGAGPMGLAAAKLLAGHGIAFQGFELHSDVGGLWDIDGPRSTMYETAHLISSRRMTEFADFPMARHVADYPSHRELKTYFRDFARHFDLYRHFRFNAEVTACEPLGEAGEGWRITWRDSEGREHAERFAGLLIANGTLSTPNMPEFSGNFAGELIHSSAYRTASQFDGKRVLIIGAGNSGCDIAVDAIHHGISCDLSMRRGYYFVPKYIFGKPADTLGGAIRLPMALKRIVDQTILKWFVGDPQKYGFPKPDYRLYESHPVVNSLVIYHAGHGDIRIRPDVERFDGHTVHFRDGTRADFDMVLAATGYKLDYPFIDNRLLNWQGDAPHLYLNCMHPERDDLFVLGMVEASGLGWQGRHEQAEMVVRYIKGLREDSAAALALKARKASGFSRATGGMAYIDLPRMAYYVDKATYRKAVGEWIARLGGQRP